MVAASIFLNIPNFQGDVTNIGWVDVGFGGEVAAYGRILC
jgi:hypothetical protein